MRQVDLGSVLGVGRAEISRYESGAMMPTLRRALELARVFRVPVEEVFFGLTEVVDLAACERGVDKPTPAS